MSEYAVASTEYRVQVTGLAQPGILAGPPWSGTRY